VSDPPTRRGRARPEPAADTKPNGPSVTDTDDIPTQLRRRRAASRRLPPLHDGRRDPLDPPPDAGKPAVIVITEDKFSVYFHGAETVLRAAVRQVGCPYQVDPRTRTLSVPKRFGDEVAVAIENGGGRIKDRGLF
jgi:hypothetical protein